MSPTHHIFREWVGLIADSAPYFRQAQTTLAQLCETTMYSF